MTDNKISKVRITIASATFITLFGTLIPFFKGFLQGSLNSILLGSPFLMKYVILLLLCFVILANGVSYLSEIFKKDRKYLKILTGILSLIIFILVLFPQDRDASPIIGWTILVALSLGSILISVFSIFEFTQVVAIMRIYSFIFALFSGIYSFFISSYASRNYGNSEAGIGYMIFGLIIFLICWIANSIAVANIISERTEKT